MAVDARRDPATRSGAFRRVGERLGINPETLRNWVVQAEIDEGHRPGTTTSDTERLAELEKEVRELRRANAILKSASAFFPQYQTEYVPAGLARSFAVLRGLSSMCRPAGARGAGGGRGLIGACWFECPTEACPPAFGTAARAESGLRKELS